MASCFVVGVALLAQKSNENETPFHYARGMQEQLRQMIESAVRMSLESVRLQYQLQITALSLQIRLLENQVELLTAGSDDPSVAGAPSR